MHTCVHMWDRPLGWAVTMYIAFAPVGWVAVNVSVIVYVWRLSVQWLLGLELSLCT